MDLNKGASVHTSEGRAAGHIDRIVIDPKTKAVIAVVVHKGKLFLRDKVVPIAALHAEPDQPVVIQLSAEKLDALPDFEEAHYIVAAEESLEDMDRNGYTAQAPSVYSYPPYMDTSTTLQPMPALIRELQVNIPEGAVIVKEGAQVLASDSQHVGVVDKVLTNSQTSQVTHVLISKGLVLKEKRLIPVAWIDSMDDQSVSLTVGSAVVAKLPPFEPAIPDGST